MMSKQNIETTSMKKINEEFDFGENLEQLILKKYKSIAAFAKEAAINKKTIEGWIGKGARFPSKPEYIKKMANALETSVHELLYGVVDNRDPFSSILEKTEIHTGLYEISIKKVIKKN